MAVSEHDPSLQPARDSGAAATAARGGRLSLAAEFHLAVKLALREMRGGLRGFYIFLACIALGTAAIAGVNSVSRAITTAIANEGQVLLGGDLRYELNNREASAQELAFIEEQGDVARSTLMRSMARLPDGSDQSLVELKAVDDRFPFFGAMETDPALALSDLLERRNGIHGAIVAPILLERMELALGERLMIGDTLVEVRAVIVHEPDAISDGFSFAPRLIISMAALEEAGLVEVGSLVEQVYKVKFSQAPSLAEIAAIRAQAAAQFPDAGWSIRSSGNAAPALTSNIERFSQFLTLVGLTALIVGGVGVANAVRAYLDGKREVIATLKCVGTPARLIFALYLVQIMIIAAIGIVIGLVMGALAPLGAGVVLADALAIPMEPALYPDALGLATAFGLITALAFAILPLGRSRDVPATALFREHSFEDSGMPRWPFTLTAFLLIAMLAVLAVATAESKFIAVVFLGAITFAFIVLRLVSVMIQWLASRSPQVSSTPLRLAIGNLHRPGALTPSVVLSLGLGLALLVTLALIDGNLRREIAGNLPERAPNFFFVDIQSHELDGFSAIIAEHAPEGKLDAVPMMRGRILALNGQDVNTINAPPGGRWVLRGDRGITYAANAPENATLTQGEWWDEDHAGEPLVSFSAEEAGELGLKVGDTVTINVLGRSVTARIANLRDVEWQTLSINFVMVFSPNSFAGAPHAWLATLTDTSADITQEADILRAVTSAYPTITSVRVKDAIEVVNGLIGQLATAIRVAAAVALLASILVLAGALAAGNRARVHDAVVLKTLGATRATLVRAFSYEYALLGLATAIFALFAGGVAAWFVVSNIMNLPSRFLPDVAVITVFVALAVTVGIGLVGTWRILGQKAAPVLRTL